MNQEDESKPLLDYNSLISIIEAYEKLFSLSREELLKAQETISAYEKIANLSREELLEAKKKINELKHREIILKKEIISILKKSAAEDSHIVETIKKVGKKNFGFYGEIFHILTGLQFSEEEAERYWNEILEHSKLLSQKLNRHVSLRVAMLDYFLHTYPLMKSPKFIEIDVFEEIMRNSILDELTGIFNRRYFNDSLIKEIKRCKRYSKTLSLFVFDLDNFKQFNDTFGHVEGDKALQLVASVLMQNFRTEDILCRTGGEEFSVILPEVSPQNALVPCERFAKRLKEESKNKLYSIVSISGGIGGFPYDGETPEEIYKNTDKYAYRAKHSGKDKIILTPNV